MDKMVKSMGGVSYGIMGRRYGDCMAVVGDVVLYKRVGMDTPRAGLVLYFHESNDMRIFGFSSTKLESMSIQSILIPSKLMTEELINHYTHGFKMKLEDVQKREMTIEQIEQKLGYPVKIV